MSRLQAVSSTVENHFPLGTSLMQPGWMIPAENFISREIFFALSAPYVQSARAWHRMCGLL
jgi:hypothetical protein